MDKFFNLPVVSCGVQSCSPVAPHKSVFDGVEVAVIVLKDEFSNDTLRFFITVMKLNEFLLESFVLSLI